eukprot:g2195.t1
MSDDVPGLDTATAKSFKRQLIIRRLYQFVLWLVPHKTGLRTRAPQRQPDPPPLPQLRLRPQQWPRQPHPLPLPQLFIPKFWSISIASPPSHPATWIYLPPGSARLLYSIKSKFIFLFIASPPFLPAV